MLVSLFIVFCSPAVQAVSVDRLQRPALPSALAQHSLLLDIAHAEQQLIAVGERGHILRSNDGGLHWQQAAVPVSVTLTAVALADAEYAWAVGHDGVVLASHDGGQSWALQLDGRRLNELVVNHYQALQGLIDSGQGDELDPDTIAFGLDDALLARDEGPSKPLLDLYFIDRNRGWVVGAYGLFLRTDDGGHSWQPAMEQLDNPDNFHLNAITRQQGALLIAGEAGVLFRSLDEGQRWERLEVGYEGPLFSAMATAEAQGFLLSGLRGRLFHSNDGGDSWEAIETATRSTLNAATPLQEGGLLAVGNGGAVLYAAPGSDHFTVRMQPQRQSYTGVIEVTAGELVMVGQKGVS
ncbi:MAG TPA: YCF48-related protein, partial [Motiliproteus sp.]